MAHAVVDELEPIEVEQQHGQPAAAASHARKGVVRSILEQSAVRQPRQRVVERLFRQLLLEQLPLRHVEDRPVQPEHLALGTEDALALLVDPPDPTVGADDPVLQDVGLPARHRFPDDLFDGLPVVGMDDRRERPHMAPDEVRRRIPRDRFDVVADELHVPVGVEVAPVHGPGDVR